MMQSVRRRFSSEARKASKDKDGQIQKAFAKLDAVDFIENKELPRHRLQRRVSRTVMVAQLPPLKQVVDQDKCVILSSCCLFCELTGRVLLVLVAESLR